LCSSELPANQESGAEKEEIDIDLNDAEVEAAALKIQASFKGYQTRKQLVRFPNKLK